MSGCKHHDGDDGDDDGDDGDDDDDDDGDDNNDDDCRKSLLLVLIHSPTWPSIGCQTKHKRATKHKTTD